MKTDTLATLVNKKCNKRGYLDVLFKDGVTHSVDKKRVLPKGALGMAILLSSTDGYDCFCPVNNCRKQAVFNGSVVICPEHGEHQPYVVGKPSDLIQEDTSDMENVMATQTLENPKMTDSVHVDESVIMTYGELWVKTFSFDHPKVNTKAYVLLGEAPNRKLCFNVFNGTLGKRSKDPVAELELEAFKTGSGGESSKPKYYILKENLEKVRTKLIKDGYVQLQ